jgi:hypothetical protein
MKIGFGFAFLILATLAATIWAPVTKVSTHADIVDRDDQHPQIGVDALGNSYIVWEGFDGNDQEIYWAKVTPESLLSVQKISNHIDNDTRDDYNPQIAVDADGNSYVTWNGYDGNDQEIYWVKITAGISGTVEKISTHTDNVKRNDYNPRIGVDALGNSYVVWEGHDGSDQEIYWVNIAATTPGSVQKISTHADNEPWNDYNPQIAVDAAGTSYVVWEGFDVNDREIYWVKIAARIPGAVQKISTHVDNADRDEQAPQVAVDAAGTSYVVWEGFDGSDQEIYWVKITADVPGQVKKVSNHIDNDMNHDRDPQVAVDAEGTSFITWNGYDGNDWEVYWVRINTAGTPGTVWKISLHPDNIAWDDFNPQVAVDAGGTSYIVWEGVDRTDQDIYWVPIQAARIPGKVQKISTHEDNIHGYDRDPHICADAGGTSYIVWNGFDGTDQDIYFTATAADSIGPATSRATVTPNRDRYASTATLVAIINDTQTGNSPIQAAEYFIDKIGKNGTGTPMSAADGGFNSPKETVIAVIDVTGLSPGLHAIYVHGQDVQGNWGIVRLVYLRIYYQSVT